MFTIAGGILLAIVIIMAFPYLVIAAGFLAFLAVIAGACLIVFINPQLLVYVAIAVVYVVVYWTVKRLSGWLDSKYPGAPERIGGLVRAGVHWTTVGLICAASVFVVVGVLILI